MFTFGQAGKTNRPDYQSTVYTLHDAPAAKVWEAVSVLFRLDEDMSWSWLRRASRPNTRLLVIGVCHMIKEPARYIYGGRLLLVLVGHCGVCMLSTLKCRLCVTSATPRPSARSFNKPQLTHLIKGDAHKLDREPRRREPHTSYPPRLRSHK
jgi:hypothetical protein